MGTKVYTLIINPSYHMLNVMSRINKNRIMALKLNFSGVPTI